MIRTFKLGDPFPDLIHFGQVLPVDTEVSVDSGARRFRQVQPGVWLTGSDEYLYPYYAFYKARLASMPDGQDHIEIAPETAGQFLWRLRDTALAAAERSGVVRRPVEDMCRIFGAPAPRLEVGGVVANGLDIGRLPQGSLVYTGHPDYPRRFGIHQVNERRQLDHVFGLGMREPGEPVTIYEVHGNLPEIPEEPVASEAELARIALLAWQTGKRYKNAQHWCGTFENTLESLGINDASISATGETTRTVGETVDRDTVALLPQGTILWWQWHTDREKFAVYRRYNNSVRTASRTRRLFGFQDDGANSHDQMVIVHLPGEEMRWRVPGHVLRNFPLGTTYLHGGDPTQYQLTRERQVAGLDVWHTYVVIALPGVTL